MNIQPKLSESDHVYLFEDYEINQVTAALRFKMDATKDTFDKAMLQKLITDIELKRNLLK